MYINLITNKFDYFLVNNSVKSNRDMLKTLGYPDKFIILPKYTLSYLFKKKIPNGVKELSKSIVKLRELGLDVTELYDNLAKVALEDVPNSILEDLVANYDFKYIKNMSTLIIENIIRRDNLYLRILEDAITHFRGDIIKMILKAKSLNIGEIDYLIGKGETVRNAVITYTNMLLIEPDLLFKLCVIKSYYDIIIHINHNNVSNRTFYIDIVSDPRIGQYILSLNPKIDILATLKESIKYNKLYLARQLYTEDNPKIKLPEDDYEFVKLMCKYLSMDAHHIFYLAASNRVDDLSKEKIEFNILLIAFEVACTTGSFEVVKFLSSRVDISFIVGAYYGACKNGHVEVVKFLLNMSPMLALYKVKEIANKEIEEAIQELRADKFNIIEKHLKVVNK